MASSADPVFVPTLDCVRRSLHAITSRRTHQAAAGYLGMLEAASIAQRTSDLALNMTDFFDRYFRVTNDPSSDYPYVVIFGRGAPYLLNPNVAGSYSPASLRPDNPFHDVAETTRSGSQINYSLRENHQQFARRRALRDPIPVYALGCFLFRDFGFVTRPAASDVLKAIETIFGYPLAETGGVFGSGVFEDDLAVFAESDFQEAASS